jgi:hypothetical protein
VEADALPRGSHDEHTPVSSVRIDLYLVFFIQPAQPTLDAVVALLKPMAWLDEQRQSGWPLFSPETAGVLIELIPDGGRLAEAGALFLYAEEAAADEAWFCVAIGMMLASIPTARDLGDDYRSALADAVYRDEATGGPYSAPVVVRAIREARRTLDDAPSVATLLRLCAKNRNWFRKRQDDIDQLLELRYQAEDHLEAIGLYTPTYDDAEDEVPL